jgi:hypothetical protein
MTVARPSLSTREVESGALATAGVLQFRCAIQSRWPVILVIFAVVLLLAVLPSRVRVFPAWVPWLTLIVLIVREHRLSGRTHAIALASACVNMSAIIDVEKQAEAIR